jgi:hypothetical protein
MTGANMSEESTIIIDFVILSAVSVSCAVIAHWRIRDYFKASFTSALAAAAVFQGIGWLQFDDSYPFTVIAFPILTAFSFSLLITGPIALLVGVPFRARRLKTTA